MMRCVPPDRIIESFLASAREAASALVLEGEAGIGKTTRWLLTLDEAQAGGFQVLSGRPGTSEVTLSYGVLSDLLAGVDAAAMDGLPDRQRLALDRILLRATTDPTPTDERLAAAAVLAVVERMAAEAPVLLAIDDVQWLDTPSRAVLEFVVRRIKSRIGVLATVRCEPASAEAAQWIVLTRPDSVTRMRLGPLPLGALHAVITERTGRSLPRPLLVRIAEISGGNPLYALELARMLDREPRGLDNRLPESLSAMVATRVGELDSAIRQLLLVASATPQPTVDTVARAAELHPDTVVARLRDVEDAGIVDIDGNRLRFTHPLLATGIYAGATPADRRATHRALADVVDNPELRARHLALAATAGDPGTVEALDAAATATAARGAPSAAAQLLEMAIGLGGDTRWRRLQAASQHFRAGDTARARTVLEPAVEGAEPGLFRALALNLLGGLYCYDEGFAEGAKILRAAQRDCADQPLLLTQSLLLLAFAQMFAGEVDQALVNIRQAVAKAEELGNAALTSQALGLSVLVGCACGNGVDEAMLRRARELEDPAADVPAITRAGTTTGLVLSYIGRLDEARAQLRDIRQQYVDRGAESDVMTIVTFSVFVEVWRGDLDEAWALTTDAIQRAQQLGGENASAVAATARAVVAAFAGDEQQCRENARHGAEISSRHGSYRLSEWPTYAVGFLELSLGDHAAAVRTLRPLIDKFGTGPIGPELGTAAFLPDAIDALVNVGELDEAERLIEVLERDGHRLDRPWMLAVGARGRAVLLAARGDLGDAVAHAQRALTEHDRLPMPFERARTLLVLGQLQRRARRRGSTANLAEAHALFEKIGTTLWAARAAAERHRGQAGKQGDTLTQAERRTAQLAAAGSTNREIAGVMFVSEKTVESNLSRVYRKLGIRSRAELGRRLDEFAD